MQDDRKDQILVAAAAVYVAVHVKGRALVTLAKDKKILILGANCGANFLSSRCSNQFRVGTWRFSKDRGTD